MNCFSFALLGCCVTIDFGFHSRHCMKNISSLKKLTLNFTRNTIYTCHQWGLFWNSEKGDQIIGSIIISMELLTNAVKSNHGWINHQSRIFIRSIRLKPHYLILTISPDITGFYIMQIHPVTRHQPCLSFRWEIGRVYEVDAAFSVMRQQFLILLHWTGTYRK